MANNLLQKKLSEQVPCRFKIGVSDIKNQDSPHVRNFVIFALNVNFDIYSNEDRAVCEELSVLISYKLLRAPAME